MADVQRGQIELLFEPSNPQPVERACIPPR
jgi:hypothetical protein